MAQVAFQYRPLSALFQSKALRRAFERAERDLPPAALGVAMEPRAPLAPGAVVRHCVEA